MRRDRQRKPIPEHPYRDAALGYGFLAVIILVVAAATGGSLLRAVVIAAAFWIISTGWTSWQFRERIRARDAGEKADGDS
jgi:FtsH-binding integral membrane protein